ncbi:SusC/RagA family TonB-linked outer membrane protein [Ohtaekwangia koreensis]|uniref:TonB-linked outer membrane protein, SusC/RagA family n=1 Tax=Ohtaekwangia koreensis TaxID=688867 RepID=A0A1T5JMR8_9BACT|nr:TonB-dependent receptor [Ohtaekwangia koreensis]SKC52701.1 TonB-linked outer membrane protein, SusC/RagA family [Ohtaekwangia koreensis]
MKKLYRSLSLSLAMMLMLASVALAQERVVTGTITDESGTGMPGVNVLVKGSSLGTATDVDGKFKIAVPNDGAILVVTFVGYSTSEVAVGAKSVVDVQLEPDVTTFQEIVVTGYTTENRREVTGAVSTIRPAELVAVPSGNVEQQLQGRVPGVTVITNGQPGTTSVVRIRGFGAFGGNDPLIIIDGLPVGASDFLSPDDIESTTVLKDAASASIYGARAANGVIVYTTKRGKKSDGKLKINYDGVLGVTVPGKVDNILNPQETADWTWQAIRNTATQLGQTPEFKSDQYGNGTTPVLPDYLKVGDASGVTGTLDLAAERVKYNNDASKGPVYLVIPSNKAGTNWWDEITRPARLNRHNLSFSGGGDRSAFYVSLGLYDQDGILTHQNFKRYTFRINSEHNVLKNLRIGQNVQFTYLSRKGIIGGSGGRGAANEESDVLSAFRMPSIIPVYDAFGGYAGTIAKGFNNPRNPVAARDRASDNGSYSILGFGNIYLELDLLKHLTWRTSFGGGFSNNYFNSYNPPSYENSENNSSFTYSEGAGSFATWTFTNTAQYKNKFGAHSIDALVGVEALNTGTGRNVNGSGLNPFLFDINYISVTNTQPGGRVTGSTYSKGVNFYSTFGQLKYNYNEKYMLTGVIRRDGASRFASRNRFGVFPAVSAAWRVSEEEFLKGVNFISDLKIRGGWGQMGNSNNVDPNNQYSLWNASLGLAAYDITGSNSGVQPGLYRSRIGNPNAKWETSTTTNIGFDASLLDGKVDIAFDVWRKNTRDLLYGSETAALVGPLATDPSINIAKMRNAGVDIEITTRGDVGSSGVNYEVKATGSFLKNEIVSLVPGVEYFDGGNTRNGNVIRNQVGQAISSYFGYKVVGLFQDAADVSGSPTQEGAAPGRFKYADINGRDAEGNLTGQGDGKINADDRTYLGDPVPDFSGGINIKLKYHNFELETFLGLFLGFENYNFSKWFTDFYPSFTGAAIGTNVKDSWTFERGGNTVPIFENVSNFSTNTQSNSYYIEKGNYARLTNLQLAYNLPSDMLSRYGVTRARIYLQATNLFTISNYSGLDPGVGGQADTTLGLDFGNPPVTRGFNIGVNLGL